MRLGTPRGGDETANGENAISLIYEEEPVTPKLAPVPPVSLRKAEASVAADRAAIIDDFKTEAACTRNDFKK